MKTGIYPNISNENYHGGPGVSKSMLDVLAQSSPLHLYHLRNTANDNREPTKAQAIGTAFHALLLEPKEFQKNYCLALRQSDVPEAIDDRDQLVAMVAELNKGRLPKLATGGTKDELVARIEAAESGAFAADTLKELKLSDLKAHIERINTGRTGLLPTSGTRHELAELLRANGKPVTLWSDVKAEWEANNGHRIVLSQEQWDQLHSMRDAVMAHPAARALMTGVPGVAEHSVYWRDQETGVICRCRPDFWREDGIIVDVKTTDDASAEGFARSISNYRYHVQHAYYMDGINSVQVGGARAFLFLAVEKSACVVNGQAKGVAVYSLDADSVAMGRAEYRRDLAVYAECERTDVWPGYGDRIQNIALPAWAMNKNAHLLGAA